MKKNSYSADHSGAYAKKRMKRLLLSERLACSPQMMEMMKNDFVHSAGKYVKLDEAAVSLRIEGEPPVLYAVLPILRKKEEQV